MTKPTRLTSMRFTAAQYAALTALADELDLSINYLVRAAVNGYLDQMVENWRERFAPPTSDSEESDG